ncbi:hypothetical protein N9B17_05030 [Rhodopirellula sp.]|nr:hypothetical protein [Rhodopirellula sp.]
MTQLENYSLETLNRFVANPHRDSRAQVCLPLTAIDQTPEVSVSIPMTIYVMLHKRRYGGFVDWADQQKQKNLMPWQHYYLWQDPA